MPATAIRRPRRRPKAAGRPFRQPPDAPPPKSRRIRRVHTARRDFHGETAENDKIPAEYTKTKNRAFPCKHEGPVSRFICRQASILVFGYFLLKKFIVRSTPIVANDRIASQKTLSRSGIAFRSSSLHSPRT